MHTWWTTRYRLLWDVTTAGPPRCPVWCRLVTVPTDPFTTFTSPTGPFLSEWAKCQPGNTQNGGTILPILYLMEDSESGNPSSYSHFIVTIGLSHLVLEMIACDWQTDRRTDNADHYYSWPPHCGGTAYKTHLELYNNLQLKNEVLSCSTFTVKGSKALVYCIVDFANYYRRHFLPYVIAENCQHYMPNSAQSLLAKIQRSADNMVL